jgi:hypothetical protein
MKKNGYKYFILWSLIIGFMACDNMELQTNYNYKSETLNPHIDLTAWEYMNSRPDIFSLLINAVEYAGMQDIYAQTDSTLTYLFINNTGMESYLSSRGLSTIAMADVNKIRKLLQYHIINGEYHAYNKKLPVEPIYVKTLLEGEAGLMSLKVNKSSQPSVGSPIANGNIVVNETGSNFAGKRISSVTSNLMPVNGVIHVFSDFAYYRTNINDTPTY